MGKGEKAHVSFQMTAFWRVGGRGDAFLKAWDRKMEFPLQESVLLCSMMV